MSGLFILTPKKIKKLHRLFTWFSIFSLILQLGSGVFLSRPAFAEEPTPPETTVEETTASEPAEEPVEEPSPAETPEEIPAEPADEIPPEEPVEEPTEEIVEEEPTEEPIEEPILIVEQEEVVEEPIVEEEIPEEAVVEEGVAEEPEPDLEEAEVAEESAELNPSVSTDKEDYAPGETVKISGENFPTNTILIVRVTRPDDTVVKGDGSFEEGSDEVTTDEEGKFEYHYQLNGIEGEYLVEVLLSEAILATTIFTDNPGYNYTLQGLIFSKDPSVDGNWTTGNVCQGVPGCYTEGDDVPSRLTITGLTASSTYSVTIQHDYQDSAGNLGYVSFHRNSPVLSDVGASGVTLTYAPPDVSCGSGDTCKNYTLNFTATADTAVLYWDSLLSLDAAEWNGASLHFRLDSGIGGESVGKKEVPIQVNQLFVLPSITLVKVVDSGSANPDEWCFDVSPSIGNISQFCIPTGESSVFIDNVSDGVYTVTESGPAGYNFSGEGPNTNCTFSNSTATATVAAGDPADDATCTFHNELSEGDLTVRKNLDTDNDGQVDQTNVSTWTWDLDGGNQNYPTGSTQSVSIGNHNISEDLQNGWHVLDLTCGGQSLGAVTAADIYVPAQGLECTFTNSRDTATITILKNIDWDESGTIGDHPYDVSGATDWTWDIQSGEQDIPTGDSRTLPTGSYTITEDIKNNYHIVGWYCTDQTNGNTNSIPVNLVSDGQDITCTITNAPDSGSISGVKFNDLDGDGSSREGGEPGLPGWTIEVRDLSGALVATTTTGADGTYSFPNLNPGTYSVCEVPQPPDWIRTYPGNDCYDGVVVGPGGAVTDQDFGNFQNVDITVCKYIDTDGDGTGDVPYTDGWLMTLSKDGQTYDSQNTGADGCYTWENLGPGYYSVEEEVKGGWTPTIGTAHDYGDVESGQNYSWTFGNFQNVSVTACKLVDSDGDINTTGDQGVKSGWTVYLSIDGIRQTPGEQTGDTGCYTWTNLDPGHSYDVEEDVPSGWTALTPTSHNFGPAQSGDESYTYTFINFENVTIIVCKYNDIDGSGDVSAPDVPLSGWEMTLHKDFQVFDSQLTGGNGCYVWNNMEPGFYQVEEEVKDGWINTSSTFWSWGPVQSGGNYRRDFTNRGALKICGTKYEDVDGSGDYSVSDLPYTNGWQISISSAHMGADVTSTDVNGDYCFENLEPGDFTVTEENRGGWTHTSPSSVPVTLTDQNETVDFFNFKCVMIWGYKWQDKNIHADGSGRGVKDPEDDFLNGWEIELHQGSAPGNVVDTALSGEGGAPSGYYGFYNICQPGTYLIKEVNQSGYTQTHPGSQGQDAYYQIEVTSGTVTPTGSHVPENDGLGFDFANFKNIKISGYKFNDLDGNGNWDSGEPPIQGWLILYWGSSNGGAITASNGYYELPNPVMGLNGFPPGIYYVGEASQAGWTQTHPTAPDFYTFEWPSEDQEDVNFGNFKLGKIQGTKYEDTNANGVHDYNLSLSPHYEDQLLNGWKIRLYGENWNYFSETTTAHLGNQGQYRFEGIGPGTYYVCEVLQNGWTQSGPVEGEPSIDNNHNPTSDGLAVFNGSGNLDEGGVCWRTTMESGLTRGWLKFGNYQLGSIGDFVWEDLNNDTVQDAGEPGIWGVTVNLYLDDGDGIFEPGTDDGLVDTDTTDGLGGYLFENLVAGDYWVDIDGTTIPPGYILTTANDPMLVNLAPGGDELGADFGYLPQPPEVSIAKENDHSGGASVGDTVTYTLTLTNGPVPLILDVIDVMPSGFSYVAGSGEVDGAPSEPAVSGNTLTWNGLNLGPGGILVITYQAKIDDDQDPGTYYNLATCRGSTGEVLDRELTVANNFIREPLTTECEIVDSSVPIGEGISTTGYITGTVLGVTTERVLGAATGSNTYWLVLAILMFLSGLILRLSDKQKAWLLKKLSRFAKKVSVFMALALIFLALAGSVQAIASLSIRVADLPEYKRTDNFKLYYTALEKGGKPITVNCYVKKDGGFGWKTFGGTQTSPSGFCEAFGSDLDGDGTYHFKAIATSPDGSTESNETTTTVDRVAPNGPGDYRKSRESSTAYRIHWKNPGETDYGWTRIFASTEQNFTADDSTKKADVGGAPAEEFDHLVSGLEPDKEYYFALQGFDKAGNGSGLSGDGGSTTYEETVVEVTPTPIGEVTVLPAEGVEEGQILAGEIEEITPEEVGGIIEAVTGVAGAGVRRWLLRLGGLAILGFIGYFIYRRRS